MWLAMVLACASRDVTIDGVVYAGPASILPVAGGTIAIRDDVADPWDDAPIAGDGSFTVAGPEGLELYAEIRTEGSRPTTFAGHGGLDDFTAEAGSLYAFPDLDAWLAPFAGCPGLDAGGLTFGEVRFSDLRDPVSGEAGVNPAAVVRVARGGDPDDLVVACMLGEEGVYDPASTAVGATGRFVVAGLPAGIHQLRVGFPISNDGFDYAFYDLWVPADGVAPWFPVTVDFLR